MHPAPPSSASPREQKSGSDIPSTAWCGHSRIFIRQGSTSAHRREHSGSRRRESDMCGIAGRFNYDPRHSVDHECLVAMTDAVMHRGPDAAGYYEGPGIGLGHRRLSIIDLATGDQPLSNEDGTVWTVFNGEIFNFADVRATLAARGHRFRTGSDTEVIVHGYEEWGERCVERFRGMFAFAIWDSRA